MHRISLVATLILTAAAFSIPAAAQKALSGRYSMHKTDTGFIRLNTQSGTISVCQYTKSEWVCKIVADDARKLESKIAALEKRNAKLEAEIRQLREGKDRRDMPEQSSPPEKHSGPVPGEGPEAESEPKRHSFHLPTEKEVDKALDYFENMLRKFQDRLNRLERKEPGTKKEL